MYSGLNNLDEKMERYLNYDGGFFVEAGANDGVSQSNTYYYERCRGWHGLLIEAIPNFVSLCKKNRPRALVHQAALVSFNYLESNIKLHCCGLMTMVEGGMGTPERCREHLAAASRVYGGAKVVEIVAGVDTLSGVLGKYDVPRAFDFLSLDVEGYEVEAMRGLDLERWRPKYVLAEVRQHNVEAFEAVLGERYVYVENLSLHDRLYRAKGLL